MEILGFITLHPYAFVLIAGLVEFWPALLAALLGGIALALLVRRS